MQYFNQYNQLRNQFDLTQNENHLPDDSIVIKNMDFQSGAKLQTSMEELAHDHEIIENIRFRYPVVIKSSGAKAGKAIILLHGLNERTWHKHLSGAKFLAEQTGVSVILFPLSFHINRGLPEWTDARKMSVPLQLRKQKYSGIRDSSLFNLALSKRLTECPQRFYMAGLQSMLDLIELIKEIQEGRHPLFEKNTRVDLFAYSISCMLIQALMISNPDNILRDSKIVLFAGGSLFSYMQGISKYIMDSVAFDTIKNYYLHVIHKRNAAIKELQPWIMEHGFSKAFSALMSYNILRKKREQVMSDFHEKLFVIALRNDRIMPLEGIRLAVGDRFSRSGNFNIVHFPYDYSHENPFPVLYRKIDKQVEQAFQSVFCPILKFFDK